MNLLIQITGQKEINFQQQATVIIAVAAVFLFLYNMPTLLRMRREWKQKRESDKNKSGKK